MQLGSRRTRMHIQVVSLHVGSECFKVRHSEVITFKLFLHGCNRCTCHQWTQLKLKLTQLYHILGARVILTDIPLLSDIRYFSFLSFLFLICKVKLCALFLSQDRWEEQIKHPYRSHIVLTYRFKVFKGLLTTYHIDFLTLFY